MKDTSQNITGIRQISNFSEGMVSDMVVLLAEMNKKIDAISTTSRKNGGATTP